jgi:vanadium chloroperoxidase
MDQILYWNDVSLEANLVSHTNGKNEQTGPTLSSRALAIVHLAMYDAFVGVSVAAGSTSLTPYLPSPPLPPGPPPPASVDAAIAAAAHATLSKLFPSQKPFFDLKHAQSGLPGPGLKEGHEFGVRVAQEMLDDRKDDPGAGDDGYAASVARGAHRPDPDNPDQGFHAPFYGARSKLFAATMRHKLAPPPQPSIAPPDAYTKALEEVRRKGIAPELMGTLPSGSSRRTVDQTLIGVYWAYDGAVGLGTPPRLYNQIVRKLAEKNSNTLEANARLFALVNTAMADAGILSWEQKYIHDLWRPVVGIREHDPSMGPGGEWVRTTSPTRVSRIGCRWAHPARTRRARRTPHHRFRRTRRGMPLSGPRHSTSRGSSMAWLLGTERRITCSMTSSSSPTSTTAATKTTRERCGRGTSVTSPMACGR